MSKLTQVASYITKKGVRRSGYSRAKRKARQINRVLERMQKLTERSPDKVEHAVILGKKDGMPISRIQRGYRKGAGQEFVDPPDIPKGVDPKDVVVLHSHPGKLGLSKEDLISMPGNPEVMALSSDRSRYRGKRIGTPKEIVTEYERMRKEAISSGLPKRQLMVARASNPSLSTQQFKDEANVVLQHRLMELLKKKGLIEYHANRSGLARKYAEKYRLMATAELHLDSSHAEFGSTTYSMPPPSYATSGAGGTGDIPGGKLIKYRTGGFRVKKKRPRHSYQGRRLASSTTGVLDGRKIAVKRRYEKHGANQQNSDNRDRAPLSSYVGHYTPYNLSTKFLADFSTADRDIPVLPTWEAQGNDHVYKGRLLDRDPETTRRYRRSSTATRYPDPAYNDDDALLLPDYHAANRGHKKWNKSTSSPGWTREERNNDQRLNTQWVREKEYAKHKDRLQRNVGRLIKNYWWRDRIDPLSISKYGYRVKPSHGITNPSPGIV